ncbi:cell envelope biogenesis protein TolA [Roseibium denhamense]|uniref:Cell division and transport-associated protein TolA n=1 Tax=Roseibium denhamense TaxID=76305 RepID=A0ABY1NK31_9HYPH|nr:cell envelope biogenesis protein TolA [Roseibium denhamense]MTI06769.1 cell envelope biogenesis protein TolA [Roseibium denhamense]SMP11132.1 Cell division and transport-associated protein TolA [Roseibium denhamense]
MRAGLIASLAGHTAILVWGLVSFPDAESFSVPQVETLPVDLIPVEEFTQLRLGERNAEIRDVAALNPSETPEETPPQPADRPGDSQVQQPTPSPAPAPPPPAAEPEPQPVAEPEPAPAPVPVAEPEPAPEPQQEAAPAPQPIVTSVAPRSKPTPPRRAPERETEEVVDQVAALLNKVEPAAAAGQSSQDPASLGSRQGAQNIRMTQSELDALRGQVAQCWSPPVGAVGAEELKVRVRFNLSQSGDVSGSPEVLNSNGNPAFRAAASSAVRAIMRCQPYSLPVAKYETWQEVIINFDPREMLGG